MSQCYLGSESKTSMKKLYFEVFIGNYFYTFNKKDPVKCFPQQIAEESRVFSPLQNKSVAILQNHCHALVSMCLYLPVIPQSATSPRNTPSIRNISFLDVVWGSWVMFTLVKFSSSTSTENSLWFIIVVVASADIEEQLVETQDCQTESLAPVSSQYSQDRVWSVNQIYSWTHQTEY